MRPPLASTWDCFDLTLRLLLQVMTKQKYMRDVLVIDQNWLVELAPNFYAKRGLRHAIAPNDPSGTNLRKRFEMDV